jgi:molecular chaperone IbpA
MTRNNIKMHVPRSLFVGFEHLFDDLERIHGSARSGDNYPPHNIVKIDDEKFLIELAVAGFAEEDISIEVKEGILAISGDTSEDKRAYVHKGISSRKFEKSFRISEFVVVDGASLVDGILVINLRVELPEEKRPRKINIGSTGKSTKKEFIQD